jgi:DNA-directed RNA polymerase subunit K
MENSFTQYEKARIIGARALQIAMNAPLLIKITQEDLEEIKFDALKIAEVELDSGVLPISVIQPLPKKKEEKLKRLKDAKVTDQEIVEKGAEEEAEIKESGEIMELAKTEDDAEEENTNEATSEIE